jgi:hypothetical protein
MYCESPLNTQSQTHLWVGSLSSVINVKSAVRQIFTVPSAEVVARSLDNESAIARTLDYEESYVESGLNWHLREYLL